MVTGNTPESPRQLIARAQAAIAKAEDEIEAHREAERRALFTWKKEVIDDLPTQETIAEGDGLLGQYRDLLQQKVELSDTLRAGRARLEEEKALVTLNGTIDGKNAEIRAAQLALALKGNPLYQAAQAEVTDAELGIESVAAQIEVTKTAIEQNRLKARIIAATIEAVKV